MAKLKGRGLGGKGLSALYAATSEEYGMMMELELNKISPNQNQPRKEFKPEKLDELAESIRQKGLIEPIVVRPLAGDEYEIIAGERRYQACKKLGLPTIKACVRTADDQEAMELALIENLHRDDLNAIEEARGYRSLIERYGMKQGDIAERVCKSRSAIANSMRLLELPEKVQKLVMDGKLSAGHARALLSIKDPAECESCAEYILRKKLSVRESEELVRVRDMIDTQRGKKEPAPVAYKHMAKKLRHALEADVRVSSSKGNNKIVIKFKDEEDLQRICGLIVGEQDV